MDGIDPLNLKVGDIIGSASDEDTREDSCHCAFLVTVSGTNAVATGENTIRVIAHDLRAGDIIREIIDREDEGNCHCDRYFVVERSDQYVTLTVIVQRDNTLDDQCDAFISGAGSLSSKILFIGHEDGVTDIALTLGADPSSWL
jgi:ferredoxin-thioredoxin reductase catalytic subunit